MPHVFISCSILAEEIEQVMQELELNNDILYVEAALHVNLDLLEQAITKNLNKVQPGYKPAILIGNKCHPNILAIANNYNCSIVTSSNCIELLLGNKIAELDQEAKTFYITNGWLKNWKKIFIEGLKWDSIDARQNFGYYDRILLLDPGLTNIHDEDILEFFEYTQVPVEIYSITLEHLKTQIREVILP